MDYLDFDLEIGSRIERDYPLSVRSPAGQAQGVMHFPFDRLELENALLKLKNALLSSGGTRRRALSESETAVQAFGQKLFEALLPDDLRLLFYESKRAATDQRNGLRLRLHIRAAELAGLPWEYLYDPRVPNYLCLSQKTPLVRYLDLPHPIEPLTVTPPLHILAMTASPSDQDTLDIAREQERMCLALASLEEQGLVSLTWLPGQTARDLQRALQHGEWHIFHFIGHGDYDALREEGVLALANEQGKTALLYATQLANLLSDHESLRLTILNACNGAKGNQQDVFSSTAATLAQRGIPAVLAMQEEITDDAATVWTHAFYEALATGLPVDAAVAEARKAISIQVLNSLEWGTPVLFLRSTDGVLFRLNEATPRPQKTKEQWVNEGIALHLARRYEEALVAFEHARELDPEEASASLGKGLVLWELHQTEEAQTIFHQAFLLVPQNALGYLLKGNALSALQRYEEALVAYARALELDPKDAGAWNSKGHALYNLQQYRKALAAYARALELDPKDVVAWNSKGHSLRNLRRYPEALMAYERALELDPENADAWNSKGQSLRNLRRYPEALMALERVLELDPENADFWDGKGYVLHDLQRNEEALVAFERALELDPENASAWHGKGHPLLDLQRNEEALVAFEHALELDPEDDGAWHYKGHALSALQRYEEALVALEHALELDPSHAGVWLDKGDALFALQRYPEALTANEKALELKPNYALAWHNKAYCLECLGRTKEAIRARLKARELGYKGNQLQSPHP